MKILKELYDWIRCPLLTNIHIDILDEPNSTRIETMK
jgi:hypothetical protein